MKKKDDYVTIAEYLNYLYPSQYDCVGNEFGIVVRPLMQCSLPHVALFLEELAVIKKNKLIVTAIHEDGLVCIR
jgi:hypothetical protein